MGNVSSDSNYSDPAATLNGWERTANLNHLDSVAALNQWCPSTSYDNVVASVSEWERLPEELVGLILDKLLESIDYVRFAAVCKQWYRLAKDKYTRDTERWYHRARPPMLLLSPLPGIQTLEKRTLCSVSQGTTYSNIQLQVPLIPREAGSTTDMFCCGSGHGWLAKVGVYHDGYQLSESEWRIELVNPFRQATTLSDHPFPPVKLERDNFKRFPKAPKVILSSDPALNPDDFSVLAFLTKGPQLAFHKRGQNGWNHIKKREAWFTDAIFYKGRFYAIDNRHGCILSFDVEEAKWHEHRIGGYESDSGRAYLVESTKGDLLCLKRILKSSYPHKRRVTKSFRLYKLELENQSSSTVTQVEVTNIEDEALFVGDTPSVSVLASKFCGCRPNSIYYTDDLLNIPVFDYNKLPIYEPQGIKYDMGIFNIADKTISPFNARRFSPAVWITTPPPFDPLPGLNSTEWTRVRSKGSSTLELTRVSKEDKKKRRLKHWLSCF